MSYQDAACLDCILTRMNKHHCLVPILDSIQHLQLIQFKHSPYKNPATPLNPLHIQTSQWTFWMYHALAIHTTWAEVASLEGQGKRTWSPYMHLRWWGFVWRSVPAFSGLIFKFKPRLQLTIFKSDVYKFKFKLELENQSKTVYRPKHPPV